MVSSTLRAVIQEQVLRMMIDMLLAKFRVKAAAAVHMVFAGRELASSAAVIYVLLFHVLQKTLRAVKSEDCLSAKTAVKCSHLSLLQLL